MTGARTSRCYGMPYVGSKNKIAADIVDFLPSATRFYDLFAGGCAITHAALLSGKYQFVIANDKRGDVIQLFVDCASGKRPTAEDWRAITREEFFSSSDPLVKTVWSYGNDRATYLWGAGAMEDTKLAAVRMLTAPTIAERYRNYGVFTEMVTRNPDNKSLRLQSLESLQRLQRLQRFCGDYQDVEILPDSVVYCDPPYRTCMDANAVDRFYDGFDFDRFDKWLRDVPFPVYVSEYEMPEDFVCVWQKKKVCTLTNTNRLKTMEKMFVHERWSAQVRQLAYEPELFNLEEGK